MSVASASSGTPRTASTNARGQMKTTRLPGAVTARVALLPQAPGSRPSENTIHPRWVWADTPVASSTWGGWAPVWPRSGKELLQTDDEALRVTHFNVVLNWFEELNRLVPAK